MPPRASSTARAQRRQGAPGLWALSSPLRSPRPLGPSPASLSSSAVFVQSLQPSASPASSADNAELLACLLGDKASSPASPASSADSAELVTRILDDKASPLPSGPGPGSPIAFAGDAASPREREQSAVATVAAAAPVSAPIIVSSEEAHTYTFLDFTAPSPSCFKDEPLPELTASETPQPERQGAPELHQPTCNADVSAASRVSGSSGQHLEGCDLGEVQPSELIPPSGLMQPSELMPPSELKSCSELVSPGAAPGPSGRPRWRRSALTRGFAVDRRHFDDCAVGELMLTRCEASRLARWCRQRGQRCRVVLLLPELVLPDEQPAEDTPAAQRPTSPLLPIDKALATPLPALSTATMPAMHVGGVCGGHATATQEGAHAPQSPQRRLRGRGVGVPCGPSSLQGCCTGRGC